LPDRRSAQPCGTAPAGRSGLSSGSVLHASARRLPDRDFLDIAAHLDLHPQWRELGWLPVAGDGCGNHYVLVRGGEVAFVESVCDPDDVASIAGAGLWMFLRTLLADG
jgi:hypothetical protein